MFNIRITVKHYIRQPPTLFRITGVRRRKRADPIRPYTIHTALSIVGRYCCTASIHSCHWYLSKLYIYTYTAISCPDMKAHSNGRQDGFLCPKVGVVQFSTSRKRYLKSTNRQNKKNPFYPGVDPSPPSPISSSPRIG